MTRLNSLSTHYLSHIVGLDLLGTFPFPVRLRFTLRYACPLERQWYLRKWRKYEIQFDLMLSSTHTPVASTLNTNVWWFYGARESFDVPLDGTDLRPATVCDVIDFCCFSLFPLFQEPKLGCVKSVTRDFKHFPWLATFISASSALWAQTAWKMHEYNTRTMAYCFIFNAICHHESPTLSRDLIKIISESRTSMTWGRIFVPYLYAHLG